MLYHYYTYISLLYIYMCVCIQIICIIMIILSQTTLCKIEVKFSCYSVLSEFLTLLLKVIVWRRNETPSESPLSLIFNIDSTNKTFNSVSMCCGNCQGQLTCFLIEWRNTKHVFSGILLCRSWFPVSLTYKSALTNRWAMTDWVVLDAFIYLPFFLCLWHLHLPFHFHSNTRITHMLNFKTQCLVCWE